MKTENILGFEVCNTSYSGMIEAIKSDIENNQRAVIYALNPNKVMLARKNAKIHEIIAGAKYLIPDGTGILFAAKRAGTVLDSRITGVSLFDEICSNCKEIKGKIFLYGAMPGVAEEAVTALRSKYPDIDIVGSFDGYSELNQGKLDQINNSEANILAVAMGSPKQEIWIDENFDKMPGLNIAIGLGGAFDVMSGRVKRAPEWVRKSGLEWIYRIVRQPISRFKNIFTLTGFTFLVLSRKK